MLLTPATAGPLFVVAVLAWLRAVEDYHEVQPEVLLVEVRRPALSATTY
jgi:hypothetical protein